jgi:hypothetical protein
MISLDLGARVGSWENLLPVFAASSAFEKAQTPWWPLHICRSLHLCHKNYELVLRKEKQGPSSLQVKKAEKDCAVFESCENSSRRL